MVIKIGRAEELQAPSIVIVIVRFGFNQTDAVVIAPSCSCAIDSMQQQSRRFSVVPDLKHSSKSTKHPAPATQQRLKFSVFCCLSKLSKLNETDAAT